MAQTGYTPILIYASGTTGNTPLAADLTSSSSGAELAINYYDGKLFYKDAAGVVQVLAGKGGTGVVAGSNTQIQFNNNGVFGASSSLTWDGSYLTVASIKDSALTNGRVTFAGASGLLSDAAGLTWDGTYLTANSIKDTALTSGRVTFAGASGLLSDSANLTWNGSTFGVTGTVAVTGALTATLDSTFSSTGALTISKGTTGQRPSPVSGMLRFNTTTSEFEGYNGTTWASVGGAAIVNDTTTATALYPLFASATTGTATTLYTGNAKLLYTPSNGELQAGEMYANNGVLTHANQVTSNYTVPTNANVITVGPWTVASGASFTLPAGSRQVLL